MRRLQWIVVAFLGFGVPACLLLKDLGSLEGDSLGDASQLDAPVVGLDAVAPPDAQSSGGGLVDAAAEASLGDAAAEAGNDAGPTCGGHAGPVPLPLPSLGFCIDRTEVSVGDYKAFLASKEGSTDGQEARCTGNASFIPTFGVPGGSDDAKPIAFVDFCDAVAYCTWAGKHVCGGRADGGAPTFDDRFVAKNSEWFAACSHGNDGIHPFPYGTSFEPTYCNDQQNAAARDAAAGTVAVGTTPTCEGGYSGLLDMVGNLGEWDDHCFSTDAGLRCPLRGGSWYHDQAGSLGCGGIEVGADLGDTKSGWGIRCCSDLD